MNSSSSLPGSPPGDGEANRSTQAWVHRIFVGPNGVRPGWRMLNAIWLWIILSGTLTIGLVLIPGIRSWASTRNLSIMTPRLLFFLEGTSAVAAILSGFLLAFFEKRSFADYGLPLDRNSGKRAAQGLLLGFAMVSVLMGLIALANGFSIGQRVLVGWDIVRNGALYLAGFAMLGFFEEFSFRGYLQATLASGIGFWPAAILLSIFFGVIHAGNPGETIVGVLAAASFGLLAAFSLWRTGSIWLAIGMHIAWDWGLTYFYSVADSGIPASGQLFSSSLYGSRWVTGGKDGPEGSILTFVTLIVFAVFIYFLFPVRQKT